MPNAPAAWPVEIRLVKDRPRLNVSFDDGAAFSRPAELLRVTSPSAEVQGHSEAQRKTVGGKRNVMILSVDPVGNYACGSASTTCTIPASTPGRSCSISVLTPSGAFRIISTISRPRASIATDQACADASLGGTGLDGATNGRDDCGRCLGPLQKPPFRIPGLRRLFGVAAAGSVHGLRAVARSRRAGAGTGDFH